MEETTKQMYTTGSMYPTTWHCRQCVQ